MAIGSSLRLACRKMRPAPCLLHERAMFALRDVADNAVFQTIRS